MALLALAGCSVSPKRPSRQPSSLVYYSDRQHRIEYGAYVRGLLDSRAFERLDALAESLDASNARFENGSTRLGAFYFYGIRRGDKYDDRQWEDRFARLSEWRDARPGSIHAPIAQAELLIEHAWAVRGGGYASTVSETGWRGFQTNLEKAADYLNRCAAQSKSTPVWYDAMLDVMHGLRADQRSWDSVYTEAISRFPMYQPLYLTRSWHLMPRWYGTKEAWVAQAAGCAPTWPDSLRDELYARLADDQIEYENDVFAAYPGLDWNRVRRGLEVWRRHFPASPEPTSALARFAVQTGHVDVAWHAFEALGDTVHLEVWSPQDYVRAREWARMRR